MKAYRDRELEHLRRALAESSALSPYASEFEALFKQGWQKILRHGDLPRWQSGFDTLPQLTPSSVALESAAVRIGEAADTDMEQAVLRNALQQMHPWRKGPFELFGVHIDTEWHSDWKWERLQQRISPLAGRTVLDIGCGSGYHLWRMLGDGAKLAVGIDPTPLFSMHFATIKRYLPAAAAFILPVGIEHMPPAMASFDTVFSMGILYHRRSPIDHLSELKSLLNTGGELVLDTLIVEGDVNTCLMPHGRYGKMRNVWFIPSVEMLKLWLHRVGFTHIRVIDVSPTTVEEQRSTEWMTFESLPDFLDPTDASKTIEGYPAPIRAVLTARA